MNWEKLLNNGRLRQSTRVKGEDARNDFESDFGRIIFSAAMRRMHDKTQVFPLTADDHIHSRLTHSMEVMAIGHSLGIKICEDKSFQKMVNRKKEDLEREIPVILKNSCLVHDIGNPPFGHFGEFVIQNYFKNYFKRKDAVKLNKTEQEDFKLFDGNAQGFRILTKLEVLNDPYGLNLTYATLATYLKYPNSGPTSKIKIGREKRGIFQSEIDYLKKVSKECGLTIKGEIVRHPLCYLMEAADSICYLVMDIEDGYNKGLYNFSFIADKLKDVKGVKKQTDELLGKKIKYGRDITIMVKFRIDLIERLVNLAKDNFLKNLPLILKGTYNKELIFDDPTNLAKELKSFCFNEIFPKKEITSLELAGHSILTGLLDYYIKFIFHSEKHYRKRAQGLIPRSILRAAFIENKLPENSDITSLKKDYYKLRIIVDFITGMTDQFALNHYQKLSGQKIN